MKWIVGIDPGLEGAIVVFNGRQMRCWEMPLIESGKSREVDFDGIHEILYEIKTSYGENVHIYLERAVAFSMGVTSAFNYGRGFAAIEIAIQVLGMSVTYLESNKWTKLIHAGIAKDLKAKAKSLIAVKRLYPKLVKDLPRNRNGKLYDGFIDALLIAGYGFKQSEPDDDFF